MEGEVVELQAVTNWDAKPVAGEFSAATHLPPALRAHSVLLGMADPVAAGKSPKLFRPTGSACCRQWMPAQLCKSL